MKDKKTVVAENLTQLRKSAGLTQAQLAEKFNYSDKAICRWEHGETLPDINTLCALADFYGVSMNDLVDPSFEPSDVKTNERRDFKYLLLITAFLLAALWLFVTVFFVASLNFGRSYWLIFVWAVPFSCIMVARLWRKHDTHPIFKICLYSLLVWTLLTSVFLHLLIINGVNSWMLFLVGIPLQAIIVFWQQIKRYRSLI
jgi:transcriptional regulator with XRE-family HTH domain